LLPSSGTENLVYDLGTGGVLESPSFGRNYLNEPVNEIPVFLKQYKMLITDVVGQHAVFLMK